jgi:glutamate/tyrosine decarboxylase-like PLP-dependent enzyme
VCFRYLGGTEEKTESINREIFHRICEDGTAVPSYTTIDGRYSLRLAITNHRSKREDFELLVREVGRIGDEIAGQV